MNFALPFLHLRKILVWLSFI